MLGRIARIVWGPGLNRSLLPVAAVSLLSSTAFSALWGYIGVWAITRLDASSATVGIMYALDATAAVIAGILGGRLSDRVGRRLILTISWGGEALAAFALAGVGSHLQLGILFVVIAGAASGPGVSASSAIVADVVPEARLESAYAAMRVLTNLGYMVGPPLGALMLLGGNWERFFIGVGVLGAIAAGVAFVFLPKAIIAGPASVRGSKRKRDRGSWRLPVSPPFLLLVLSTFLGYVVYIGYEVVLPVAAVSAYDMSPTTWGLLLVISPVLVTVLQVRVSSSTLVLAPAMRICLGLGLMGAPFLLLLANWSVPVIASVIVIFVFGEMIWAPTAQSVAARLAPEGSRGTHMGFYGASVSAAWSIGPLVALTLQGSYGEAAAWVFLAAVALAGACAGTAACVLAARSSPTEPRPADAEHEPSETGAPRPGRDVDLEG